MAFSPVHAKCRYEMPFGFAAKCMAVWTYAWVHGHTPAALRIEVCRLPGELRCAAYLVTSAQMAGPRNAAHRIWLAILDNDMRDMDMRHGHGALSRCLGMREEEKPHNVGHQYPLQLHAFSSPGSRAGAHVPRCLHTKADMWADASPTHPKLKVGDERSHMWTDGRAAATQAAGTGEDKRLVRPAVV
eukprot:353972-Chlamydomonas_euryale.AAC.2